LIDVFDFQPPVRTFDKIGATRLRRLAQAFLAALAVELGVRSAYVRRDHRVSDEAARLLA
jgi:hypothetical protein